MIGAMQAVAQIIGKVGQYLKEESGKKSEAANHRIEIALLEGKVLPHAGTGKSQRQRP
jgi:hypothetical protein